MRCGKAINKVDDEVKASGQIAVHATWPCDLRIKLQWKLWRERILKRQQKENEMVAVAGRRHYGRGDTHDNGKLR